MQGLLAITSSACTNSTTWSSSLNSGALFCVQKVSLCLAVQLFMIRIFIISFQKCTFQITAKATFNLKLVKSLSPKIHLKIITWIFYSCHYSCKHVSVLLHHLLIARIITASLTFPSDIISSLRYLDALFLFFLDQFSEVLDSSNPISIGGVYFSFCQFWLDCVT